LRAQTLSTQSLLVHHIAPLVQREGNEEPCREKAVAFGLLFRPTIKAWTVSQVPGCGVDLSIDWSGVHFGKLAVSLAQFVERRDA
jgi:hypothetical protein